MVSASFSLLATLALTASASKYANTTTTATVETTVYTTVCPATSIYTSGTKTLTSVYTTTSTITSCKGGCPTQAPKDCEKVRSDCQSKPDANQAVCAALYAQCAGTTSGLNKPPVQTSNMTMPQPTGPQNCEKVRSDCQSKPDANQAVCAALYAQCAGTTSGLNKPPVNTGVVTYYTTVCPATSTYTSGSKTWKSVYTTTSTVTSCPGGCPSTAIVSVGTPIYQTPATTAPVVSVGTPVYKTPSVSTVIVSKPIGSNPVESKPATTAPPATTMSSKTVVQVPGTATGTTTTGLVMATGGATGLTVGGLGFVGAVVAMVL